MRLAGLCMTPSAYDAWCGGQQASRYLQPICVALWPVGLCLWSTDGVPGLSMLCVTRQVFGHLSPPVLCDMMVSRSLSLSFFLLSILPTPSFPLLQLFFETGFFSA